MKLIYLFVLTLNAYNADLLTEQRLIDDVKMMCRGIHKSAYSEHMSMPGAVIVRCVVKETDLEDSTEMEEGEPPKPYQGGSKRAVSLTEWSMGVSVGRDQPNARTAFKIKSFLGAARMFPGD